MPGAGGNSFTNNPIYDVVIHPAGSDAERGIPALGKEVYRTDLGVKQVCTSTSPNPTLNGGGTWTNDGGAGYDATVLMTQGHTVYDSTVDPVTFLRLQSFVGRAFFEGELVFTTAGIATNTLVGYVALVGGPNLSPRNAQIVTPPPPQSIVLVGGYEWRSAGSIVSTGAVLLVGGYSAGTTGLLVGFEETGGNPGSTSTVAIGDEFRFSGSWET